MQLQNSIETSLFNLNYIKGKEFRKVVRKWVLISSSNTVGNWDMVSQVGEARNRSLNMAFKVTKAYNRTKILTIKN